MYLKQILNNKLALNVVKECIIKLLFLEYNSINTGKLQICAFISLQFVHKQIPIDVDTIYRLHGNVT
jgi:hypothetical protein